MKLLNLSKYKSRFAAMALVLLLTAGSPGHAFAAVNPTPDPQEPGSPTSSAADTGSNSQPNSPGSEAPVSSDAGVSSIPEQPGTTDPTDNGNSSSQPSSSSKRPSSSKSNLASSKPSVRVNTDEDTINRAASRAARATSDPDVLSSQDWNELLTSSAVSEADEDLFNRNTPEDNEKGSGGFSLLLAGGILCIVLGVGGIAFFIYSQFFADEPLGGGKKKTKGKEAADLDSTIQFEDIQSDSSGKPLRDGYVPPKTAKKPQAAKRPATGVRPQPPTARRAAQPKPPAANPDAQTKVLPTIQPDAAPLSQKPEGADKESFDWDTFFKDQEKK